MNCYTREPLLWFHIVNDLSFKLHLRTYDLLPVELQLTPINILSKCRQKNIQVIYTPWYNQKLNMASLQLSGKVTTKDVLQSHVGLLQNMPQKTLHRESLVCSGQPLGLTFYGEHNTKPSQRPNLSAPASLDPTPFLLISSSHIHAQAAMMMCQENRSTSHTPT